MNKQIHPVYLSRKRFDQNFLHDSSIIDAIVAAIHPKLGQAIVEIGPGLGALTEPIAEQIDTMTIIEIDRDLASRLARHSFLHSKLNILQQDVMTVDFSALSVRLGGPLRIFGNLPYSISTPLMFHLFRYIHAIRDMHFMLQKEVANRLIAGPNKKIYGRLSVMTQYYCNVIPVLEVPPTAFRPMPKVDSLVVRLIPYTTPPFPVYDLNKLRLLINLAFNQRRKMLSNSLGQLFNAQQLSAQGISAKLRAENLSIEHYCQLANVLAERFISQDSKTEVM